MNSVIELVTPVFGLGLLGYFAARCGWFSDKAAEGLAHFVFDWAVPILLIRTFANTQLPTFFPWQLLLSFYGPLWMLYVVGMWVAGRSFRRDFSACVVTGFACTFGNTVLLGLPLVMAVLGDAGTVPYFIILSIHGLTLFTVTTILLEYGRNREGSLRELLLRIGKGLVRNPIILGLAIGVMMNQTGLTLPGPIDRIAESIQLAVMPCALFSLGASLTRYGLVGRLKQSWFVIGVKNVLFPACVWLLATWVFQLEPVWAMVAVLLAAQPSGVNVYLFAERYGAAKALATTTVFLSTTVSVGSISFLLYLYQLAGS